MGKQLSPLLLCKPSFQFTCGYEQSIIAHSRWVSVCVLTCLVNSFVNAGTAKAIPAESSKPHIQQEFLVELTKSRNNQVSFIPIGSTGQDSFANIEGISPPETKEAKIGNYQIQKSPVFLGELARNPYQKIEEFSYLSDDADNRQINSSQLSNSFSLDSPLRFDKFEYKLAQSITPPIAPPPPQDITPPPPATPVPSLPQLPPPEDLLTPGGNTKPESPQQPSDGVPGTIFVEDFQVEGSTVFSQKKFAEVLKPFTKRRLSFTELLQARSAITELYVNNGYITSGALIPPQTLGDGIVKIQVVEGGLESINVTGLRRLNSNYVRSRIALATKKPLNVPRLLDALRVLQLDPLIKNLSAELMAGSRAGLNVLSVQLKEADTWGSQIALDNGRSPSVGSFRRRLQLSQANLLGLGDGLSIGYTNTDGSNGLDLSYTLPVNDRNGSLNFSYGTTSSNVIEEPFNRLDIVSDSRYYELSLRQPLLQTPSEEFALGLTASRRESETSLLDTPYPLSQGADDKGRTRISSLRFFQEWTKRSSRQVIAARSQLSVGIGAFDATINNSAPDSRFVSWRVQGQWVRLLAPDTLFLLRGDVQLADRPLVPTEQFGLGGLGSVRGYRQDFLLTDNGALLTAELRYPLFKKSQALLQIVPFVDIGTAWNSGDKEAPQNSTLASAGLGLQFSLGDKLTARLDWGLPIVSVDSRERTWQENGLYFSISVNPF